MRTKNFSGPMDSLQSLRMSKLAAQITAIAQNEETEVQADSAVRGKLVPREAQSSKVKPPRTSWAGTTKLLKLWNEISELDRTIVRKIVVEQRSPQDADVIRETGLDSDTILSRLESISRKLHPR